MHMKEGDYRNGYHEEIDREENRSEEEVTRKEQEDNQKHGLQKEIAASGVR